MVQIPRNFCPYHLMEVPTAQNDTVSYGLNDCKGQSVNQIFGLDVKEHYGSEYQL